MAVPDRLAMLVLLMLKDSEQMKSHLAAVAFLDRYGQRYMYDAMIV